MLKSLKLGIDTGGTYTDAVILDAQQQVLATCKSLTTHHDLSIGIGEALTGLPDNLIPHLEFIALSTTLTTNSIVEERGAPVCLLLSGYNEQQIIQSGLRNIIADDALFLISGGHDATGKEREPVDMLAAKQAILSQQEKASAFAISSIFGIRNPSHEIQLRSLVQKLTSKPVACGHELTTSLGAPQRALTAALNARMVPYIQHLIEAVQKILVSNKIKAPLMIVKGDGSLINTQTALQQPVSTVLSGPAASVVGASALSGLKNAIVADMGGTTTDVAIIINGRPELCSEGAKVGDWHPMVEAVKVYSLGLGGDSEVQFNTKEGLGIGPRRVLPMCLLGMQYPWVIDRLEQQLTEFPNARNNRFVTQLESNEVLLKQLSSNELSAWKQLEEGPIELEAAVNENRQLARSLAKLQRLGLAIYSGFTPTDAAHVLEISNHWCKTTASLAAKIWARQFRQLYGIGNWKSGDTITPCKQIYELVISKICNTIVEAGLHKSDKFNEAKIQKLAHLITNLILEDKDNDNSNPLFKLDFAQEYSVVAVGAPSASYYPEVTSRLGIPLHLPKFGDVANAIGAVMGSVVQRSNIVISQPSFGIFSLYHKSEPRQFSNLDDAIKCAQTLATTEALELAKNAGTDSAEVVLSYTENQVNHETDGEIFFDGIITATALGRPNCDNLNF
ncbi:MAG: hydantoinase/oxoprolinase family protein [Gammaproteobacteria bacterium]|nr:hydantoinase/oxoprolinase family protein [Gammaproteobacteria bacterium]